MITYGSGNRQTPRYSVIHNGSSHCLHTFYLLRVTGLVVYAESLSLSILAQNCPAVSRIRNIEDIMVNFSSNDCNYRSASTMVAVQHGHLTVNFLENLFNHLIQLTSLVFLDFFSELDWEHFLAVLRNCLPTMSIKYSEKATGLVSGDLVHVAVGVLHLWPKLSIRVLIVAVFFN